MSRFLPQEMHQEICLRAESRLVERRVAEQERVEHANLLYPSVAEEEADGSLQLGIGISARDSSTNPCIALSCYSTHDRHHRHTVARFRAAKLQLVDKTTGDLAYVGPVVASDLWERRGAIIFAARRVGCSLCREQALDLTELVTSLKQTGELDKRVPLLAIVKQVASEEEGKDLKGMVDFGHTYFSIGPIYYDRLWTAFKALGRHGQVRRLSLAYALWIAHSKRKTLYPLGKRLAQREIVNEEDGDESDGFVKGGIIIMGPGQTGPHYIYREQTGQRLPVKEIRSALLSLPRPVTWP